MTHEQLALFQTIIGVISGGLGVAIINWLSNRKKNKLEQRNIDVDGDNKELDGFQKMQEFWHNEFNRLERRIVELESDKSEGDINIKELKEEIKVLQDKVSDRDGRIQRLTARIRELERLMKKYGIDPDKVSEDKPNE